MHRDSLCKLLFITKMQHCFFFPKQDRCYVINLWAVCTLWSKKGSALGTEEVLWMPSLVQSSHYFLWNKGEPNGQSFNGVAINNKGKGGSSCCIIMYVWHYLRKYNIRKSEARRGQAESTEAVWEVLECYDCWNMFSTDSLTHRGSEQRWCHMLVCKAP